MGCISSREMMRSASYHRNRMKGRSRRTSKGVPELPEDLLIRRNHNHFLALVCSATSMTDALRPKSLRFESLVSPAETEGNESTLKVDLLDDKDRRIVDYEGLPDPPKRSRSWHSFPLEETLGSDKENNGVNTDTCEMNGKGATRSRSFHTVEEYNKLLERIWSVSQAGIDNMEADPVEKEVPMAPPSLTCCAESNYQNSQQTNRLQGNGSTAGESSTDNETSKEISPGESTSGSESKGREVPVLVEETDILSESCLENDDDTHERSVAAKGFKRKTIARGLETLQIPSTFELPAVASLREWLPAGQVFSPGAHPTTKFGSYLVPTATTRNGDKETVFDEDLVTVLEEQLQQLKAEEETILEHITSTWEGSASTGMKKCASTS